MFFVIFFGVMSLLALYVCVRLFFPLKISLTSKILLSLFVLICANKMIILRQLTGGLIMNQIPNEILIFTGWLHISVVLMAGILILFDLSSIVFRKSGIRIFTPLSRAVVIGLLGMSLSAWGIYNALQPPLAKIVEIPITNLPAELEGFKIAHLSDIHIGPLYGEDWAKALVSNTNATKSDVIVVTGDVVDGTPSELSKAVGELAKLDAKYGKYLSMGNHEYYSGVELWRTEFGRLGFKVLYNQHVVIKIGEANLVIGGVTDLVTVSNPFFGHYEQPDMIKTFAKAPKGVRVLLEHQPKFALDNVRHDVDLQLSGHTHGGLLLPLQSVVAHFNGGFVSGLYRLGNMNLYVSNGTGLWAGFPVRLFVPSEIVVLRLVKAQG